MSLSKKAVLITGGSRGLGRALGARLAELGAKVVLVARDPGPLNEAVEAIRAAGGQAWGISADVGEKEAVHAIAGEAAALAGPIDVAILNASTLGAVPMPLLLDTECEDLERVLQVNLIGPFRLTKILAGSMALRGSGTVVAISSDAAVAAYPSWGAYGASKAALDHMTRTWAAELADTGVRFLSVDPGEMNTRMHADALPDADPATLADPNEVAGRLVEILRDVEGAPSGARVEAAAWGAAA